MPAPKGHEPYEGGGRPKGSTNKNTAEIKDMIRGALNDAGGQKYLCSQAKSNPVAFMGLIGKIIPQDVRNQLDIGPTLEKILAEAYARRIGKSDNPLA